MTDPQRYHLTRFTYDAKRELVWRTLCDSYFQKLIGDDFHVLDIGAGHASFINNVRAARRTAIDLWPGLREAANPGVDIHIGDVTDLSFLPDRSIDFAFSSNVFEHLSQGQLISILDQLRPKLSPRGTLNILQPNFRYCFREYFDDYTHISVYSHISLADLLEAYGFEVFECHPRFLPLTVKSRLPVWPLLIKLYLASPLKPMGKQMLLRSRVGRSDRSYAAS